MNELFVAWQEPESRSWFTVGKLSLQKSGYRFVYTKGAQMAKGFPGFGRMTDLNVVYVSDKLFPLFANRVLPPNRPEYKDYLNWLGLEDYDHVEMEALARTGGLRATDTLEIYPCPRPNANNIFEAYFFSRGIRHLAEKDQEKVLDLRAGAKLYVMKDLQNEWDCYALLMRTGDPISVVGYCPRYYSAEFTSLLDSNKRNNTAITVERVNRDAPMNFRLLCKLAAPWPTGFSPCSGGQYEPLVADWIGTS